MSREDQVRLGSTAPDPKLDDHPEPKTSAAERDEQKSFANWLLLQNGKRAADNQIPFSWHATHTKSKATPGTPDFFVGVRGTSLWIEFKRDYSCDLSPEQEKFRLACEAQRIRFEVVYSAAAAIKLVEDADDPLGW